MKNFLKGKGAADFITAVLFVVAVVVVYFSMENIGLGNMMASSLSGKFLNALMAVMFMRVTLFVFDKVIGFDFRQWKNKASTNDMALYLSFRIMAIAIMFGMIIG